MSRWVTKLKHQLESTHCESQDQAAEVTEARAMKLHAVERATATERGLDMAKVRQVETKATL